MLWNWSYGKDPLDDCYESDLYTHFFCGGSTGVGKSSGSLNFILSHALDARKLHPDQRIGGLVLNFKKNEAETFERLAFNLHRESDVIVVRPEDSNILNFLQIFENQEPLNCVEALLTLSRIALGTDERKAEEAFWEQSMRRYLDRLIRTIQLSGERLSIDLMVQAHLSAPLYPGQASDPNFQAQSVCCQLLAKALERCGERHEGYLLIERYFMQDLPNLTDKMLSSVRAMVDAAIDPFVSSALLRRLFCGSSTLDLAEIFSGKLLILDLPVQTLGYVGRFAQILLKYLFQLAVEARDLSRHPNGVLLIQDEAQAWLLERDFGFLSTCRSSKCGVLMLTQNISNVYAALGGGPKAEAKAKSLLGLCNHKIFHANNDYVTNQYAADTIGKVLQNFQGTSISRNDSSVSQSQQMEYQVPPVCFTTFLKTGGPRHGFEVGGIVTGTGKIFSTGTNYLATCFKQPVRN